MSIIELLARRFEKLEDLLMEGQLNSKEYSELAQPLYRMVETYLQILEKTNESSRKSRKNRQGSTQGSEA